MAQGLKFQGSVWGFGYASIPDLPFQPAGDPSIFKLLRRAKILPLSMAIPRVSIVVRFFG